MLLPGALLEMLLRRRALGVLVTARLLRVLLRFCLSWPLLRSTRLLLFLLLLRAVGLLRRVLRRFIRCLLWTRLLRLCVLLPRFALLLLWRGLLSLRVLRLSRPGLFVRTQLRLCVVLLFGLVLLRGIPGNTDSQERR
jgi:hypothetical protein